MKILTPLGIRALVAATSIAFLVSTLAAFTAYAQNWAKLSSADTGSGIYSSVYAYVEGYTPIPADGHLYNVRHAWGYNEPYPYIVYCHQAIPYAGSLTRGGYQIDYAGTYVWSSIVDDSTGICLGPSWYGAATANAVIYAPPPGATSR